MQTNDKSKEKKEKSYEEEMSRFEQIVSQLSTGDVSLSDSIKLFKEGQQLSLSLKKKLDDFNNEILKLSQNSDSFIKADIKVTDDTSF